jgi:tetratricopeptide (TPR) repeat protein
MAEENKKSMLSMLEKVMKETSLQQSSPVTSIKGKTPEEQIALFNQSVDEGETQTTLYSSTCDFTRKQARGASDQLSSLCPISLSELEVSKTHRGCVVYCKIVTRVLHLVSVNVLVQDETDIKELAIYGNVDSKALQVGRNIAIKEPFYKMRMDGTEGIRIDDPEGDFIFDPEELSKHDGIDNKKLKDGFLSKQKSVEERVTELVGEDGAKGAEKIYVLLIGEGYDITKKRVRALKKAALHSIASTNGSSQEAASIQENNIPVISIFSERCPEKHRILKAAAVFESKQAGNLAFQKKHFEEADALYSKALKHRNDPSGESTNVVELWQLYCNRSAARLQMGHLHEALQDSLMANMCASAETIKPLLRCAEVFVALGLHNEAISLLKSTADTFPISREMIEKKVLLLPKKTLQVGKDSEFSTITEAIQYAPAGSEILVDAGIYRENLFLTKPITLRCNTVNDFDAIQSLEGNIQANKWAEIYSVGSIICNSRLAAPIHIIGFKISCESPADMSVPAIIALRGITVFRNCVLSSSSGPVVCAESVSTKLLMQACVVHRGAQGGILCANGARLSLHQIHCCNNAASGLELRSAGRANLEGCHFYSNGRQGIMVWQGAGALKATNCEIHSHQMESGVLVSEAEAILHLCKIYGNCGAGIVSQQKGNLLVTDCEVHSNLEGILIQDTGSGRVERCNLHSNNSTGVFIGFDHRGSAAVIDNRACNNRSKGVLVGNSRNVVVRGNTESGNLGFIPKVPTVLLKSKKQTVPSAKYFKRAKKNKASAKKAPTASAPSSFIDCILDQRGLNQFDILDGIETYHGRCSFCHLPPQENKKPFAKCSRCKIVSYCSPKCQKSDWSMHKKSCHDASIKYPSFLDNNTSV